MGKTNKSILIVGVGGQGTLLTSRILGNLFLNNGYDVKLSEVHGMAQRGGSVVTHVRYGEQVDSPIIPRQGADVILAFEKLEAYRWIDFAKPNGVVIVNEQQVDPMPVITGNAQYPDNIIPKLETSNINILPVDALAIASRIGNIKTVNTVLLGVLAKYINIEKQKWIDAIKNTVPEKTIDINIEAFERGYRL
ncbi:MAG: indolepyruvate oxidoreductase subunit beta [Clostridia bacterium]|nr:indolepyruvate oxidoreductase subunit beta [Clostridia bacterium]